MVRTLGIYREVKVVDKLNGLKDLVMVLTDALNNGDQASMRVAFVLSNYVMGELEECNSMLREEEEQDAES